MYIYRNVRKQPQGPSHVGRPAVRFPSGPPARKIAPCSSPSWARCVCATPGPVKSPRGLKKTYGFV